MKKKVSIIGAGSWGTALAVLLAKKGIYINLWVYEKEVIDSINTARENIRYLPGVVIPDNIVPFMDMKDAIKDTDMTVLAVPSQLVRNVSREISGFIDKNHIIVNVAKGLEVSTQLRMSQVIEEEIPQGSVVILSGPSHAEEVGKDIPTTVVCASRSKEHAEYAQDMFMGPKFRVYTNPDIVGVEMGGALKNIIALGAGISDGLGFGDNAKAALMTRGIVEIARLGEAMGGSPLTFAGLSGIGDLIVTCTSMHSRNRRAGIMIGEGKNVEETLKSIGMVVEGVTTCKAAYALAKKLNVEMPITEQIYSVIFENKNPKNAVVDLMLRNKTHESEEIVKKMDFNW